MDCEEPASAWAVGRPTDRAKSRRGQVRVGVLKSFAETVSECGGDAHELMRSSNLAPQLLRQTASERRIDHGRVIDLFASAATALGRPDFGLRLAARQSPVGVAAPIALVMQNSITLRDAFEYSAERAYAYSDLTSFSVIRDEERERLILRFDICTSGPQDVRQSVEHALFRINSMALRLSGGRARPIEIWFRHLPLGPVAHYRKYFNAELKFSHVFNAIVLDLADEDLPVVDRDEEVLQLAKTYIDDRYARPGESLEHQVRKILGQRPSLKGASTREIAASLGMHPRTFQRRLRDEGLRFDAIKDALSREHALKYLQFSNLPLIRIANLLGYSELSAFSHKCRQWFSLSPRELRRLLKGTETGSSN